MNAHLPEVVSFGREICGQLDQAERREWWLSNGLGGYAAGTIAGTLTRRYHGLLVAPVHPPLGRLLVVAKADAFLLDGERMIALCTNRWRGGAIDPHGYRNIESFRLEGRMPVWRFAIGDLVVEQRIWMEQGAHTTYVAFRLVSRIEPGRRPALRLRLLVNARDHHGNSRAGDFAPIIESTADGIRIALPGRFDLNLGAAGGGISARHDWFENFDLPLERERGLPDADTHLCAGEATLDLTSGEWIGVSVSVGETREPHATIDLEGAMRRFLAHDAALLRGVKARVPAMAVAPPWIDQLVLAADSFIFSRPLPEVPDGESVIAGYPWFGDWGRDTMIALPGLALATGRFDTCARVLRTFARFVDRGMLPNVFPGAGETPDYNTVDAALWYIEAWRAYVEATDDRKALAAVFPVLCDIVDWHVKGTRYRIALDPQDGLLHAGESGVQITWMDAKVGDWVVTPRIGKPVEINALWYNGLVAMGEFARLLEQPDAPFERLAERARVGFQRFINTAQGGLYDVLDGPHGNDPTLRPNQIFAVSLPHSPLDAACQSEIVNLLGRELLTSYGLRSLSPSHPDYRPCYQGGIWERDGAYHQGPVWAWLLGPYTLAHLRVHGDVEAALALIEPMRHHLLDAGLGTLSEIFDGMPPHTPRGAPCQAWSVACTLEAWWRLQRARTAAAREPSAAVP